MEAKRLVERFYQLRQVFVPTTVGTKPAALPLAGESEIANFGQSEQVSPPASLTFSYPPQNRHQVAAD